MEDIKFTVPKRILSVLSDQIDGYYLAGGTALSMMYFQHRESYDLDFFTKNFSKAEILKIVDLLTQKLDATIELAEEQLVSQATARMVVYKLTFKDESECKIDFVEDFMEILHHLRKVDGIHTLSLEDIYLRKIYTVAGHIRSVDTVGRDLMVGGRQEAKDFFDLYYLSTTSRRLSEFIKQFENPTVKEGLIRWFKTYDRMTIKMGLLDLITHREPDYRQMEGHFEEEIDKIVTDMIEEG